MNDGLFLKLLANQKKIREQCIFKDVLIFKLLKILFLLKMVAFMLTGNYSWEVMGEKYMGNMRGLPSKFGGFSLVVPPYLVMQVLAILLIWKFLASIFINQNINKCLLAHLTFIKFIVLSTINYYLQL